MSQKTLRLQLHSETLKTLAGPPLSRALVMGMQTPELGKLQGGVLWSLFWCNEVIPKIGETASKIASGVGSAASSAIASGALTTEGSAISAGASAVASAGVSAASGVELSGALSRAVTTITG